MKGERGEESESSVGKIILLEIGWDSSRSGRGATLALYKKWLDHNLDT